MLKMSKNQKKNRGVGNWTQLSVGNAMSASQRIVRRLSQSVGVINTNATGGTVGRLLSSQCANAAEWANLAAIYVQFRVIEMILTFVPLQATIVTVASNANVPGQGILLMGTDRSGALATPGSLAAVWGLNNPKAYTTQTIKPMRYKARAIDLEDQDYIPIASPVSTFAIQYASNLTGVTASIPFVFQLNEFVVEFKGAQA
jgi:hypothetical protein